MEMDELRRRGVEVVVIYPILIESYNLLVRRVPLPTAHTWLSGMLTVSGFLNPAEADYLHAADIVRRYSDQPLTLSDAVLAGLSMRLALPVWSYDHHFDVLRVPRWTPES